MPTENFNQRNIIKSQKTYAAPKPGSYYTVEKNMTLKKVSLRAYGYNKSELLVRANTILQKRPVDSDNNPLVYQDDIIWLPPEI